MVSIGLWMYSNEGGNLIRSQLAKILQEKGVDVYDDVDLNLCVIRNGKVYEQSGREVSRLDILYHMNADMRSSHQPSVLQFLFLADKGSEERYFPGRPQRLEWFCR